MFLLILGLVVVLQVWTWTRLVRHVASGALTRLGAVGRYVMWACAPAVVFLAGFFGAVGLEEWLGLALIPEPLARASLLIGAVLLGGAGLGSLCFAVRCAFLPPQSGG
ncbi:MAG: hypothetical protein OEM58_12225 [Nitrospirota bacterium]|nr:hypothetical protein [Nitrospirota bacterium]